jgi:hypothetical protein
MQIKIILFSLGKLALGQKKVPRSCEGLLCEKLTYFFFLAAFFLGAVFFLAAFFFVAMCLEFNG